MDLLQIGVLFKFANYCYDITMICSLQDETFMLQSPRVAVCFSFEHGGMESGIINVYGSII